MFGKKNSGNSQTAVAAEAPSESLHDLSSNSGDINLSNAYTVEIGEQENFDEINQHRLLNKPGPDGEEVPDFSEASALSRTAFIAFTAIRLATSVLSADVSQPGAEQNPGADPFEALSVPAIEQIVSVDDGLDTPQE